MPLVRLLVLAVACCINAEIARAEPELTLRWEAPESAPSCPDAKWASEHIAAQLGRAPNAEIAQGVNAHVVIEVRSKGFALTLQTREGSEGGARTLEGARCEELAQAAILIIALGVNEASERAAAQAASAPSAAPAPPAKVESTTPTPPPSAPAPAPFGFARAELVLSGFLWNRLAFGPGLSFALQHGMFRAEASGFWLPPLTLHTRGPDIEASLGAARASACLLFGRGRVTGGGCAGGELGGARGRNQSSGLKARSLWAAALVGARLTVLLVGRLSLVTSADVVVALARPSFRSRDQETGSLTTLLQSAPVQLRASIGPELRF